MWGLSKHLVEHMIVNLMENIGHVSDIETMKWTSLGR
jgi:hypothetical protein